MASHTQSKLCRFSGITKIEKDKDIQKANNNSPIHNTENYKKYVLLANDIFAIFIILFLFYKILCNFI